MISRGRAAAFWGWLCSFIACAWFSVFVCLPRPADIRGVLTGTPGSIYDFFYLYATIPAARYLALLAACGVLLLPLLRYRALIRRRLSPRAGRVLYAALTLVLLAAFAFALYYLLPQFPLYAQRLLPHLYY